MRLVLENGAQRVVALENLERYLAPATEGVQIGNVGTVLRAIRTAAAALVPPTYSAEDLERITDLVFSSAEHLKAVLGLVDPANPDAAALSQLLAALGLTDPPPVADPPPPLIPVNASAPMITGTAKATQVLTGTDGTWTGQEPITFTYRWWRCDSAGVNCAPIVLLAQASTYTVKSADVGSTLRFRVTATNGAGSAAAYSDQTAVVTL